LSQRRELTVIGEHFERATSLRIHDGIEYSFPARAPATCYLKAFQR
jgi:hypothetical protein